MISRCAARLWSAKESGVRDGRFTARASPRWDSLTSSEQSKLKRSLVGHATAPCTYWKINLVKLPVGIDLQCRWISKSYRRLFKRALLPIPKLCVKCIYYRYVLLFIVEELISTIICTLKHFFKIKESQFTKLQHYKGVFSLFTPPCLHRRIM